jgi:hypothetical protein
MTRQSPTSPPLSPPLFRPSLRAGAILVLLVTAALGLALFLRYDVIQNTPIGLACEAGEKSLTCTVRLAAILLFIWGAFGWAAVAAAAIQLWRPNLLVFSTGFVTAAFGLVLYNTRLSALAVALLVLSLARDARLGRSAPAAREDPQTTAPANSQSPHSA